jgi:uncharacterized protein
MTNTTRRVWPTPRLTCPVSPEGTRQPQPRLPREVFVDTSALYAALDSSDESHGPAAAMLDSLLTTGAVLATSSSVLLETVSLLQSRLGLDAARAFLLDMVPCLDVAWVDAEVHARAVEGWIGAAERRLSLVDCTSFALMHELRLDDAFTFDRHFADFDFRMLP